MDGFYKGNIYPVRLSPKIILVSLSRRLKLWLIGFHVVFLAALAGNTHSSVSGFI